MLCVCFAVLGLEPGASCLLGEGSTSEPSSQPYLLVLGWIKLQPARSWRSEPVSASVEQLIRFAGDKDRMTWRLRCTNCPGAQKNCAAQSPKELTVPLRTHGSRPSWSRGDVSLE